MENKPIYARKPYPSASLYGFSYGSWCLSKKKWSSLGCSCYSEVENDPPDMPTNLFNKSGSFLF